jgi:hypothetical protein
MPPQEFWTASVAFLVAITIALGEYNRRKIQGNTQALNGVLEKKVELAHEAGYQLGVVDGTKALTRVDEHEKRIEKVEKSITGLETNTSQILDILTRPSTTFVSAG